MVTDAEVALSGLLKLGCRRSTCLSLLSNLPRQLLALSEHVDRLLIVEDVAGALPKHRKNALLNLLLLPSLVKLGLSKLLLKHVEFLIFFQQDLIQQLVLQTLECDREVHYCHNSADIRQEVRVGMLA